MPEDFMKDTMTKTYGIRNGEPKRPESLIEMPGIVPEVPEVSLCFNQENNKPLQSNKGFNFEVVGNDYNQRYQQNEMLHRNKYESYNTWREKNAQALHNITGSLEKIDPRSKCTSSTKRSVGLVRKQSSGKEIHSSPVIAAKYPINEAPEQGYLPQQNVSKNKFKPRLDGNYAQLQLSTSNELFSSYSVEQQHKAFPVQKHPFPQYQGRHFEETEEILKKSSSQSSNVQNPCDCKNKIDNVPYNHQLSDNSNDNSTPIFCVPNYCSKPQCSYEKEKLLTNPLNASQFANEKPTLTKAHRGNDVQFDAKKLFLPLDSELINNHLSSLSHIVNIQKEQISLLYQEISSQKLLMTALLQEVKQIHAAVSPCIQRNNDLLATKEPPYQGCFCEDKNGHDTKKDKSEDSKSSQIKLNGNSDNKQTPVSPDNIEKRSVGVMTSSLDSTVDTTRPYKEKDKSRTAKDNLPKAKNKQPKLKVFNSPSPNKNKPINKESTQGEEKRKPQSSHTQRRMKQNAESNKSSQSDDSFSLDEAAVITRTEPEQGDFSPDVSIHVNMPDYSASSAESDTSDNSDSEDEGQESGTEGESSDPQIGWTFYNRVVGQVNNMLKKTSSDSRQEYAQTQRKNLGNVLYQCNGDYETENNWSKRVTFDGPPLEDSDNNGMHMPRYHHFRTNQDYRMTGGPERMQDFLIRDYANGGNNLSLVNGSTNVSFATYRYYQRHQLLPPPPPSVGVRIPDQVFLDPPQVRKKNKSRKSEKTSPMFQKTRKRRSGGPPSRILDMSALKHQPKLF